jgi:hypothetical protein
LGWLREVDVARVLRADGCASGAGGESALAA